MCELCYQKTPCYDRIMECETGPATHSQEAVHFCQSVTNGAVIDRINGNRWKLQIPPGPAGNYRLAQFDDYRGLPRKRFHHLPPFRFTLRARASHPTIPGTWGFGFWNDPFGLAMPGNIGGTRLPNLPNAIWFFHASQPNHLSLVDDLPGEGWLAATYRSNPRLNVLFPLALPLIPLILFPATARILRRMAVSFIHQDARNIDVDVCQWQTYQLVWQEARVQFIVNGSLILETRVVPLTCLGMVLWVDNQYLRLSPDGRWSYGTLANPQSAWIEFEALELDNRVTSG
jgi:hypothetical protein